MAPSNVSFDQIIQSGRERKQAEKLANDILGKERRASTPQLGPAKAGAIHSLASRISKPSQRSASSSPAFRAKLQPNAPRSKPTPSRPTPLNPANAFKNGPGLTIRGLAGPYVVVASNFAPGTTSADIQSAMESVGGPMESCRVVTSYPTVMAEMVFLDKPGAETVIANFNNQKADGRLLHVYMKTGGPSPVVPLRSAPPAPDRPALALPPAAPTAPREVFPQTREPRPRETNGRGADPEYQDGRYGFEERQAAAAADTSMDVDEEGYEVRLDDDYRDDPRDDRYANQRRDDRRDYDARYRAPERETGVPREPRESRGNYRAQERSRPGGGMEGRRLYSDDLYASQRGRGFR